MSFRPECVRSVANWTKVKKEHKFEKKTFDADQFLKDMPMASPKLVELMKNIEALDKADYEKHAHTYKHFIFSDLKMGGTGAKIIASALTAHGFNIAYNSKLELKPDSELLETKKKNFILLASTTLYGNNLSSRAKKQLLSKFNERPSNVYGDLARIIVMDSGFKEGIDLFDIKYVHIFEPQISGADQKQVIGRGTRTCGQKGLRFHPTQGWPLEVYVYDVELPLNVQSKLSTDLDTLFKVYMSSKGIDLNMLTFADELEKTAIVGSVDYELNKNIHRFELEDETQYDIFGGASYKPSLAASTKLVNCEAKSCGRVRANKHVPVITPVMTAAALAMGVKLPKFKSKGAYPREFYCELLKTTPEYCEMLKEANTDPVKFIKKYSTQLLASIKKGEYRQLPISQRSSFLRLVFMVLPRPEMEKKLKKLETTPPPQKPKSPKPQPQSQSQSQSQSPTPDSESESEIESDSESESESTTPPESPSEVIENAEKDIKPITPPPLSPETSRTGAFLTIRNYVKENFQGYTWPKVKLENMCGYDGPPMPLNKEPTPYPQKQQEGGSQIMTLTPTQGFVSEYFTPQNPMKGMLFWHSVGTGKTCSAIATASKTFEQQGYKILWVTRTTLKSDIWKNMFDQVCSSAIVKKINKGVTIPADYSSRVRLLSSAWSIRPMSYKTFSNLVRGANALYQDLVKVNGKEDPLKKTLIIIDEAHKLYGGDDLSKSELPDMNILHKALMNSYQVSGKDSVKLILMTATPITKDPMELIKLLNLMRTSEEQLPTTYSDFQKQFLSDSGLFTKKGKFEFLNQIAGHISYLNRERDARQFAQPHIKYITAPISEEDGEYGDKSIEELQSEIDKATQSIVQLKEEEKTQKQKLTSQKKELQALCTGLKKDEKAACVEKSKEAIDNLVKTFNTELLRIKEEAEKAKDTKNSNRKQITVLKKSMKDGINQMATLQSKCASKTKKPIK